MGLINTGHVIVGYFKGIAQCCNIIAFSNYCAYTVYGGTISSAHQGAMKLIEWESICTLKNNNVQLYDFVGARIDPERGSKQEALSSYKKRMGGSLKTGFMWRYPLSSFQFRAYSIAVRLLMGGDIVDQEHHKLQNFLSI